MLLEVRIKDKFPRLPGRGLKKFLLRAQFFLPSTNSVATGFSHVGLWFSPFRFNLFTFALSVSSSGPFVPLIFIPHTVLFICLKPSFFPLRRRIF